MFCFPILERCEFANSAKELRIGYEWHKAACAK